MAETDALEKEQDTLEKEIKDEDDIKDSFLKGDEKDMHRLSSAVGRALKGLGNQEKTTKEVMDTLQAISGRLDDMAEPRQPQNTISGDNPLETINQKIQDGLFSGEKGAVVEALDMYFDLRSNADRNISKANQDKVNKLIGGLKGKPFINEIKDGVRDTAFELINEGLDAEQAVAMAYNSRGFEFSSGLIATLHKNDPKVLETLKQGKGGTKPEETREGQLPSDLAKQWQKD